MFRSVLPFLEEAAIAEPVVCYQGAAVVDPTTGTFLLHEPLSLEIARDVIRLLADLGHPPNCYVDDRLYVDVHTEYSRRYAEFQHLPVEEVGDLVSWLVEAPTKLVAVADPEDIPELRARVGERFAGKVYLTTSLPHLLEMGNPAASKGTGIAYVADYLGLALDRIVSFGDGENDIELIGAAGFGIAVEDANPLLLELSDWVCPSAEVEGVAAVIESYLESRP